VKKLFGRLIAGRRYEKLFRKEKASALALLAACCLAAATAACGGTAKASGPTPMSGGGSSPSTNNGGAQGTTVYDRIEEQTDWQTCGNCGNTGGSVGATANYHMGRGVTSPSTDGSSAVFSISGPGYKNGYWYISHLPAPSTPMRYLRYEFDIMVPAQFANAPEAIEFECQQSLNGWVYNFAWQGLYPGGVWRTFNYTARQWESTGVPFQPFTPGVWHHVVSEFHNDPKSHRTYHDTIAVDGVKYKVPQANVHAAMHKGSQDYFNNAFQLDLNSKGTPYKVYVDGMKVTYR
jgi:hypothetical protein